jgi:hypothetical protein
VPRQSSALPAPRGRRLRPDRLVARPSGVWRAAPAGPYGWSIPGRRTAAKRSRSAPPGLGRAVGGQWTRRSATLRCLHVRTDGAPAGPGRPLTGPRTLGNPPGRILPRPRALSQRTGAGLGVDQGTERRIPNLRARPKYDAVVVARLARRGTTVSARGAGCCAAPERRSRGDETEQLVRGCGRRPWTAQSAVGIKPRTPEAGP